jgi:hypothetical protein
MVLAKYREEAHLRDLQAQYRDQLGFRTGCTVCRPGLLLSFRYTAMMILVPMQWISRQRRGSHLRMTLQYNTKMWLYWELHVLEPF